MTRSPQTLERRSLRAFRALLGLYPAAFRDEYGRELSLVFVDRYRDATGAPDRVRLWLEAGAGILSEAPKEHLRLILQDLRFAWRVLRQHAIVTASVVVILGLGIGANTAVFSLLNAITLRTPLPIAAAGHLYVVNGGRYASQGPEGARVSGPSFDLLRQAAPGDVGVAAMSRGIARVYTRTPVERDTVPASLQLVSPSFFSVIGVTPALGQLLPEDDRGNEPLAVISHAYWQRRFGGSAQVLGSALTINGADFTIAGVGPRDFAGVWLETPVDVWVPLTAQPLVKYSQSVTADGADLNRPWLPQSQIWWLHVIARVPPEQVATVAGLFNASLASQAGGDAGIVLQPLVRGLSRLRQQLSTPLVLLMVMAALVLLTACANVANLLLARAVGRQRELAVRRALGAGRARLFHQLLTESVLLVGMAGGAAILFARWGGDALLRVATATTDGRPPFAVPTDVRVLVFAASVALLSVVVFGVWPAWRVTRVDLVGVFAANARTISGGAARPARALVVLQVALSLLLVTGAGLFARSFQKLLSADLGIQPARVLSVGVDPRLAGASAQEPAATYARVLEEVTRIPGVESAAFTVCGPQGACAREDGYQVEGYLPRESELVVFSVDAVTPGYFSTVGMTLLAGRALSDTDRAHSPRVAVVNRTLAARYFDDWRQALGRRFGFATPDIEIVGIVDDARNLGDPRAPAVPGVFVPLAQRPAVPRGLQLRTSVDPGTTAADVRRAIATAAPGLPIERIEPLAEQVRRGLSQERLLVLLTSGFGLLALALAAFGLFGMLSYAIARRVPEIGLRIALGASPSGVSWGVVRESLRLVLLGALIGLPLVAIGGKLISGVVFGVSPFDPLALIAALLALLVAGIIASAGPARRASRVDPMVTLRQE